LGMSGYEVGGGSNMHAWRGGRAYIGPGRIATLTSDPSDLEECK
jgi:hypothetical protein